MRLESLIMTLTSQIATAGKQGGMPKGELDVLMSLLARIQNMIGDGIQPHEIDTLGKLLGKAGDMIQDPELKNEIKKIQKKLKFLKETGLLEHLLKDPAKAGFGGSAGSMGGAIKPGEAISGSGAITENAVSGVSGAKGIQQPNMQNPFEEVHPDQINELFDVAKGGLMDNEFMRKAGETYKAMRREIAEDAVQALLQRSMNRVMGIESTDADMTGNSGDSAHKTNDDALNFQLERLGNLGGISGVSFDNGQVSSTLSKDSVGKVGGIQETTIDNARSMQHDAEKQLQDLLNNLVKPSTENKIEGDVDLQSRVGSAANSGAASIMPQHNGQAPEQSGAVDKVNPTPPSEFGSVV